ncbi:MAG: HAMP domain-containing sensor histidine kinase [Anaerolineales bacterium]|nr:HAMP domain-containing histidine kinase [Anaerolineales bacterium]MDW8446880.1 HAMP domain-containing sensor histidine kinase [Anaerolineales bacterium]
MKIELANFVSEIAEKLTSTSAIRPSLEKEVGALLDALSASAQTGDPSSLDNLLESWISQYTQAELPQIASDLASFLHSIEHALIATIRCHLTRAPQSDEASPEEQLIREISEDFFRAQKRLYDLAFKRYAEQHSKTATEARVMLEKLEQSKSNFISIAAHELKTPLTIIEGYSTMLADALLQEGSSTYRIYLEGMRKGVERLKQIVQDMIDVSLIDSRMLLLNFQPCLINRLIETVVEDMKRKASDRDLLIQWRPIPRCEEQIYLDEVRLSQALRNVIENAIKYTPDGGRVSVYGRRLSGFIEIVVEDTGIGVDPENQTRIFEKFSQLGQVSLHSSSKSKFKGGGAGLGLPIAKGILEAHGGTIWVESPGYDEVRCPGSTFHLMVPVNLRPPRPSLNFLRSDKPKG